MNDKRRELWWQSARRFTLQVYSFSDRKKSGAGAFRMIAMGAEDGVVRYEVEPDWVQAALRQDDEASVGTECNRSDCIAARCQRWSGERASCRAGYASSANWLADSASTNPSAGNYTASLTNGYCRDVARDAARCRCGRPP
jgi:hypothetical protein